ncbi:hypothetical protein JHK82_017969 [Glycine max]|uniref:Uncharacterized protein n=1 Tax=Glycine max TaxID=3847 RepID=K7L0K4_SOYBN|nr:hypothetical protein JHK85_018434 [Glycine max]KAG5142274.1 hypothetical protein JHK82_017969 [Glycine max]KAH1086079.1 hypothetical protein GYH30_017859 [Glycine max]KRH48489.1 hypothetical protein GLYMA_07G092200v4 [Glycine max]
MCLDIICGPAAAKIHRPLSTCLRCFHHLLGCWLTFEQHGQFLLYTGCPLQLYLTRLL